jgi:hypothetical protein
MILAWLLAAELCISVASCLVMGTRSMLAAASFECTLTRIHQWAAHACMAVLHPERSLVTPVARQSIYQLVRHACIACDPDAVHHIHQKKILQGW